MVSDAAAAGHTSIVAAVSVCATTWLQSTFTVTCAEFVAGTVPRARARVRARHVRPRRGPCVVMPADGESRGGMGTRRWRGVNG